MLELPLAYLAGLLTLINPCVLPVLPIVLASALNADRRAPIALAAGMSVSFVTVGMLIATLGYAIGLTEELMSKVGATLMIVFGLVLLVPAFSQRFELAAAGFSGSAGQKMQSTDTSGLRGQFLGGILLGAVWSPCIGPTLGGAIALASQGESLTWAALIMCFFALGVSTLIVGLGLGAGETLRNRTNKLRGLAERSKPIMGLVFLTVGVLLIFNVHHMVDAWAMSVMPIWLQDLSVRF
ncbi:cytochrome c biogenesis CcdA family protein [Roseibium porphyridii]|uniref:Cytochrome c biogenesis CcdA family protein n=1 Tax=Roseibium porphyridii TaxID=2866279 RepID=A0ABY8F7S2_9HYPH|nr:cytochrome c biogenesis CcdA family protein [Roseibium sp. KMA01]WFE90829.1 cytochrome c biogenesis CcdA family protein [Roseibium sp. KMA01]